MRSTHIHTKVKSESEVAQLCPTLFDPMDCSPWTFPGKSTGLPFPSPGDLPDPGIKAGSPALQAEALPLSHQVFTENAYTNQNPTRVNR